MVEQGGRKACDVIVVIEVGEAVLSSCGEAVLQVDGVGQHQSIGDKVRHKARSVWSSSGPERQGTAFHGT